MAVTISPGRLGTEFALGAVGLSIETEELATQDLNPSHKSLVALMRLLGPGVLRVGGNSLDDSWWTSDAESSPPWATNVVTPGDLAVLKQLLVATGWRVILGVDLGHFAPRRAADETRAASRILGSRLLGVEIGNLGELAAYSAAIHAISPAIPLYGPELAIPNDWLATIASAPQAHLAMLTEHYYPTSYSVASGACTGTPVPTATDLLSYTVREQEDAALKTLVSAGTLAHRPTRITETNTTASCDASGGPDTGPVFASALWSFDWILRATSAGVVGLNFHGYFGLCRPSSFSPICATSSANAARGQTSARPEYYGLLAARQLEGGRFLSLNFSPVSVPADLTAYATLHPRGTITLALENFSAFHRESIAVRVPGYLKATSETLVAPSVNATSGVTFGRASFGANTVLRPRHSRVPGRDGEFLLEIAPASAVVMTLDK